jgi:hypothetical protein
MPLHPDLLAAKYMRKRTQKESQFWAGLLLKSFHRR